MAEEHMRDPWQHVLTYHDLPADEVISALQKEVRRSNVDNAVLLAYEMYLTSAELEEMLWSRLQVISVEDVGWGDLNAPVLINALNQMRQTRPRDGDRLLFAIHATRYLAEATKDRSTDELINWMKRAVDEEGLRPTIPDYALDMHTARGQHMQRDFRHFIEEGAQVKPELSGRNTDYRERLLQLLDAEK